MIVARFVSVVGKVILTATVVEPETKPLHIQKRACLLLPAFEVCNFPASVEILSPMRCILPERLEY